MTRNSRPAPRTVVAAAIAAALLGTVAVTAAGPAPAALADAVDDSIAELKEAVKANDEGKAIAKITDLETKLDGRITDALADVARTAKSDRVAKAAMKAAAQRKDPELIKWLKGKLDDKKMAEDHPERYLAVLDSVGFYGDKSTMKPLEDVVKKYLPTNSNFSKAAIRSYGSVREKAALGQLIKWLRETENTRSGGQSGKNMSAQTRDNYDAARGAVLKALEGLTLQDMGDAATWEKWWKENEKTFEFPDLNQPEIDYATLTEYVDRAYGFTLKKPTEGKFWQFAKPEMDGGRITLQYRDAEGLLWARSNGLVWKGSGEVNSLETFAQYYEKLWREKEFAEFGKGGEPATEMKKIGGRDFAVVKARGIGADSWKSWEGCERRVYITRANPSLFLYFECAIRTGADDPLKAAFWAAYEGLAFKGPAK